MKAVDWVLCIFVRLAIRRGVLWQSNLPAGFGSWDERTGWRPLFSIRYGKTPVYAFPGMKHLNPKKYGR